MVSSKFDFFIIIFVASVNLFLFGMSFIVGKNNLEHPVLASLFYNCLKKKKVLRLTCRFARTSFIHVMSSLTLRFRFLDFFTAQNSNAVDSVKIALR